MLTPRIASSAAPTPLGRKAGNAQSEPQTTAAPTMPAHVENARLLASRTGRSSGLRAAKTTVASVTPSLAIHAVTRAVTVRNATVPRPDGPRERVTRSNPTNSPELPMICAQNRSAGPRPDAESGRLGSVSPTHDRPLLTASTREARR